MKSFKLLLVLISLFFVVVGCGTTKPEYKAYSIDGNQNTTDTYAEIRVIPKQTNTRYKDLKVISFTNNRSKPQEEWTPMMQSNYNQNMAKYILLGPIWGPIAGMRDAKYAIYHLPPGEVHILVSYANGKSKHIVSADIEPQQTYYLLPSENPRLISDAEWKVLNN